MEMGHDIAKQQIVDVARREDALDHSPNLLNIRPVRRDFVGCKIGEGRDMSAPKHHGHVPEGDGLSLKQRIADSATVEGVTGQIGTKRASDTSFARVPVMRPGSCHERAL
jgi:hypothetical protein